jgi:superfamily II DNA or RNA helicase
MPRVIVKNTCISIEDYELGSCKALEKCFMVWNPINHKMDILGMHYDSTTRTLTIPRGLDIWKIKQWLGVKYHETVAPNEYAESVNILMKYKPKDQIQEEALKFMLGLDQYDENAYQPQLSVNLNTGKGKTYCSIATIAYMKIKSIVITGSTTLLNQWKENIKEYTSLHDRDVYFISGSSAMNMILTDKSINAKYASIFLCTHGTIRSFGDTYGWDKLNEVFKKLGIGIKFIDEAHTNFTNMLMMDFFTNVYKTYYVTATPNRSSWQENKIYRLSFKNVPFVDLFDPEKDPHTDYVALKWNSHPEPRDISRCKNAYGLDRNKYIDFVTRNPYFYQMMYLIMDMYIKCGGKALFYIGTNEGILRVYKWIVDNYPQVSGEIGIFTSLLPKEEKIKERDTKKLLLTTTKSAGLGEDIKGLKLAVILAEPFKSEVLTRQALGRLRDNDTMFIELVDMGFRQILKYYYYKLPVLNKYALSVSDSVIDNYELRVRSEKLREKQSAKKIPFHFIDKRFFDENGNKIIEVTED